MIDGRRALTTGRELAAWAAGRRRRYRVQGLSMEPTLLDGEFVLVESGLIPMVGELALVTVPDQDRLEAVKRVSQVMADGRLWLTSDNHERGMDSRRWGALEPTEVGGRVTLNLTRPLANLSASGAASGLGLFRWLRR